MSRRKIGEREAFWRGVISRQRASGLSIAAFCRKQDVSPPSFFAWRRRLAKCPAEHDPARQATPEFVPVNLAAASAEFEVRFPNGVSVVVPGSFAEAPLARLLQLVAQLDRADA